MTVALDKLDVEILYILYQNQIFTDLSSWNIKEIQEFNNIELSYFSILRRINKKLVEMGYVLEGYKVGNTRTFYLSQKGIDYLKDNILCKSEIYEYVEEYEEELENE